jgi:hypothetical protein
MVGPPGMEGSVVEVGAVAELAPMPPFGIRRLRDAPDDASHAAPAAVLAAVEAGSVPTIALATDKAGAAFPAVEVSAASATVLAVDEASATLTVAREDSFAEAASLARATVSSIEGASVAPAAVRATDMASAAATVVCAAERVGAAAASSSLAAADSSHMGIDSAMQWLQERWDRAVGPLQNLDVPSPLLRPPLLVIAPSAGAAAAARVRIVDNTSAAAMCMRAATEASAATACVRAADAVRAAARCAPPAVRALSCRCVLRPYRGARGGRRGLARRASWS